jgi:hypothetical protein
VTRLALALAAFLLAAPVAGATIVPQQGMAGVRVGMTRAQVEAALGTPLRVVRGTNDFGRYTELRYPFRVRVLLQGDVSVTAVWTTGRRERTASGVGVGSTEAEVRAGVRGVRCETVGGFRSCSLGSFRPGARVTDFQLRAGRVVRVTVGLVID